jgi:iron complex outermembrane receptor protein
MHRGQFAAHLFRSAALGALLAAAPAVAQVTETSTQPVETVQPTEAESQDPDDRVVITGSRIPRDAFTSTAPIQVITAEASTLEGLIDTAEILQGSTVAAGSTQFNNTFGNFVIEGGPGIASVSLRGLGAQRSLVLLNNQRPGPAGVRGQVGAFDLNVIPDSIISRVEILKDGASSIYGSDAVAGVANIITRTSVDQPELYAQYNATEKGGGNALQLTGAIGFNLFGGQQMLAFEYENRDPLKWGDRKNLACAQDLVYDPNTGKRIDWFDNSAIQNTNLANCNNIYFNTVIDSVTGLRYVPSPDGVVAGPIAGYRPGQNRGFTTSTRGYAYYEDITNDARFLEGHAISGVERLSLYGKADFTIFDGVDWSTEALITRRELDHKGWRQFAPQIASAVGYDVPGTFNAPAGFGTLSNGLRVVRPITIWKSDAQVEVDYYYVNSGLKGDFILPGWNWTLNASYSMSDGEYRSNEILNEYAGDWNFVSPSDGLYHGPNYNAFDPAFLAGNYSQALFDQLTGYSVGTTTYEQTTVQGILAGDVFELPAGPLGVAVGAEWRNFEIDDTPDEREQNGEFWNTSSALITRGEDTVKEAFIEANVPLLRGLPFIEELTIDGSARAFEYDSYGSDSVWKAGLNWQVIPSVRVRGTQGTSYRAPALYELYLGNLTSFLDQTAIDPCINWGNSSNVNLQANCAAAGVPNNYTGTGTGSAVITSGGGFGVLESETSEAQTLGIIWTPDFIDLSIAVDYFDITVNDQVAQLGAGAILGGCYGAPIYPNAFCSLFTRNSPTATTDPNAIATVNDSYLNVNSQSTRGLDFTVRYEHELDFGDLAIDLSATHTMEDVINLFDPNLASGFETNDFSGTIGDPEWVANAQFRLDSGDYTYAWSIDYIGETDNEVFQPEIQNYLGRPGRIINYTDPWLSHDFSVRWTGDQLELTAGVTNIFDAQAPVISENGGQRLQNHALAATQYDLYGRTFWVRAGYAF